MRISRAIARSRVAWGAGRICCGVRKPWKWKQKMPILDALDMAGLPY
ncbi:MAG TPA: hypothetical protein VMX97_00495 [Hyphomicrobiaceae bacterium]|nr:hypothetical protein [Hyphomicrobiaceae bacterium]